MTITADIIRTVMPHAGDKADLYVDPLNTALDKFEINTDQRIAAFLAQIAQESGELRITTENLNYSAQSLTKVWPNHFDSDTADAYAHNQEKIADRAYANRNGNGDEDSGDGWLYRGRGLIQITGRSNYQAFMDATGIDAINNPDSLAEPDNAAMSAAWFWHMRGCNILADNDEFTEITKKINGELIGQEERVAYWDTAKTAVSV